MGKRSPAKRFCHWVTKALATLGDKRLRALQYYVLNIPLCHRRTDLLNTIRVKQSHRNGHPSVRALSDLATRAGIPAFVAHYADDFSVYRVVPLNEQARIWIPQEQRMSEEEWVDLLYRLRGRTLPKDSGAFC